MLRLTAPALPADWIGQNMAGSAVGARGDIGDAGRTEPFIAQSSPTAAVWPALSAAFPLPTDVESVVCGVSCELRDLDCGARDDV